MGLANNTIKEIRNIVGRDAVLTSETDLKTYSFDATSNWQSLPDVVAFPGPGLGLVGTAVGA